MNDMRNITLSIEEMQHLQDLGLDTSDASMFYDESGGISDYQTDVPAYTLQDILEKLPKIIETETDNCECHINLYQNYIDYRDSKHNFLLNVEFGENILDAAYQMLIWCIKSDYIKIN